VPVKTGVPPRISGSTVMSEFEGILIA